MKITKRTTMRSRRAISEIIAIILVVGLTIVAAGILYTYFSTTASRASNTAQFQVSADLVVPNGTGAGTLAVSITNSGSVAITGITMTASSPLCTIGSFTPSGTLPPGSGASGTCSVTSGLTAGQAYSFTLTVTYANGQTQTQVVSVTAH